MGRRGDSVLTFISLFAGIGGMDLGLERAGMRCVAQVEIDDYANRVLEKNWPDVPRYRDVREVGKHNLPTADIICGGFPCQDLAYCGLGAGLDGERSGLWREYHRIIRELRPRYVLVENVAALLNRGIDRVLRDLATCGYDAEWRMFRASDFGLPHRRERLFIVAYPDEVDGQAGVGIEQNRTRTILPTDNPRCVPVRIQAAHRFIGMDDGVPARLYEGRAGGIGNAVAVPVAEFIGNCILKYHKETTP
jgi:DNA (cytosine-5)-methyltransferase 1